jgi:pimeloyl-ACP methyl ester carboxylesterase
VSCDLERNSYTHGDLIDGALCYRGFGPSGQRSARLARDFTVYTYDHRGRGESTGIHPYAAEREIEDVEALIDEAGGSVYLYDISSGAGRVLPSLIRRLSETFVAS